MLQVHLLHVLIQHSTGRFHQSFLLTCFFDESKGIAGWKTWELPLRRHLRCWIFQCTTKATTSWSTLDEECWSGNRQLCHQCFFIMTGWVLRCYRYLLLKGYLLWPESIMRIFFEPNQSRFLSCLKFVRLERCSTLGNSFPKLRETWNLKSEILARMTWRILTFQVAATESVSAPWPNLPRYELLYQQLVDGASV